MKSELIKPFLCSQSHSNTLIFREEVLRTAMLQNKVELYYTMKGLKV